MRRVVVLSKVGQIFPHLFTICGRYISMRRDAFLTESLRQFTRYQLEQRQARPGVLFRRVGPARRTKSKIKH